MPEPRTDRKDEAEERKKKKDVTRRSLHIDRGLRGRVSLRQALPNLLTKARDLGPELVLDLGPECCDPCGTSRPDPKGMEPGPEPPPPDLPCISLKYVEIELEWVRLDDKHPEVSKWETAVGTSIENGVPDPGGPLVEMKFDAENTWVPPKEFNPVFSGSGGQCGGPCLMWSVQYGVPVVATLAGGGTSNVDHTDLQPVPCPLLYADYAEHHHDVIIVVPLLYGKRARLWYRFKVRSWA